MILRVFLLCAVVLSLALPATARSFTTPDCPSRSSQWSCPIDPAKIGNLTPSVELPCPGKGLLAAASGAACPAPVLATALPVSRHSVTLSGIGGGGIDRPPKHAG